MHARKIYRLGLAATLLLSACGQSQSGNAPASSDSTAAGAPASNASQQVLEQERYIGMLPCADCPGMRTELLLNHEAGHEDGEYILSETYLGRSDTPFVSQGVYTTLHGTEKDSAAVLVQLNPGKNTFMNYLRLNDFTLAFCGKDEIPPQPGGSHRFNLDKIYQQPQAMEGTFRYLAGLATLTPCGSKTPYPVAATAMYAYAEQLYRYKRTRPNQPMRLVFEGVTDSITDGSGKRAMGIVITSVKNIDNQPCPAPAAAH
jgi:copper homeostasis protein (lipoprotein)